MRDPTVTIVDFGMGNLFSVRNACQHVGLVATISSSRKDIERADGIILPGVGGFPEAIRALHALGLVDPLCEVAAAGKPILGICLGHQLLFDESEEFGVHKGLGIIPGRVVRFEDVPGRPLKIPHVGWEAILPTHADAWRDTLLDGVSPGEMMYFIHSFHTRTTRETDAVATSVYGGTPFCASVRLENVSGCQFHPERSGPEGLRIYANLRRQLEGRT